MSENVNVIGVYKIPENSDVHLIEMEISERPSLIDINEFTQPIPNKPKEEWQAAYNEYYLNSTGDNVIGDYFNLPKNDESPTRLAFFMYFIDFKLPLASQFGNVLLPKAIVIPQRLKEIITFEDVD